MIAKHHARAASAYTIGVWETGEGEGSQIVLPPSAVTEVFAMMGKRGSGKTYGAGVLAENFLASDAQIVVLDPVGNWWGLRLAEDGKSEGYPIPVLGGDHGDLDLVPEAGAVVADMIVDTGTSVVLDISQMTIGQRRRFVTDWAERFFHRKAQHRTPVHVFIEEAHVLLPQKCMAGEERMLGAMQALPRRGRNYGIGVTIIDQRPQSVSKDSINQAECLFVYQLVGKLERKAILEWAEEQDLAGKVKAELGALSQLEKGHCLLWSPSWLKRLGRVKIARKATYDASRTPEIGDRTRIDDRLNQQTVPLARVDLASLQAAMAAVVAKAKGEDPRILRSRIADLETEVHNLTTGYERRLKVLEAERDAAYRVHTLDDDDRAALDAALLGLQGIKSKLVTANGRVVVLPATATLPPRYAVAGSPAGPVLEARLDDLVASGRRPTRPPGAPWVKVARAIRDMGRALTQDEAAILCGYSAGASTLSVITSKLRKLGWITDQRGALDLTDEGHRHVRDIAKVVPSISARLDGWAAEVKGTAGKAFRVIANVYPHAISAAELCKECGISGDSSTLSVILSKLRKKGLIEKTRGTIRAVPILFEPALGLEDDSVATRKSS